MKKAKLIYPKQLRKQEKSYGVTVLPGELTEKPDRAIYKQNNGVSQTVSVFLVVRHHSEPDTGLYGCKKHELEDKLIKICLSG